MDLPGVGTEIENLMISREVVKGKDGKGSGNIVAVVSISGED